MIVFLQLTPTVIVIRARAESTVDGELCVGDYREDVPPGGQFGDIPYDVLRSAGSGEHSLASLQAMAAKARADGA